MALNHVVYVTAFWSFRMSTIRLQPNLTEMKSRKCYKSFSLVV